MGKAEGRRIGRRKKNKEMNEEQKTEKRKDKEEGGKKQDNNLARKHETKTESGPLGKIKRN